MKYLMSTTLTIIHLILILHSSISARILGIFPIKARSLYGFNKAIIESLANAGHHITLLSPFVSTQSHQNITFINTGDQKTEIHSPWFNYDMKTIGWWQNVQMVTDFMENDCYDVMEIKEIRELMASCDNKYDVIFVLAFFMNECYFPLARKCRVPVIGTFPVRSMSVLDEQFGNPHTPAVMPFFFGSYPAAMTFYERFRNTLDNLLFLFNYKFRIRTKIEKFFHQYSSISYAENDLQFSLVFGNNHPSIFPRSTVPTYIDIGGITVEEKATRPLPEDIKTFIEEADHGVILFSLGSLIRSDAISKNLRNIFVNIFSKIPQRVIWKFEEHLENLPNNVLRMNWLPQQEILAHSNVKAFISHCGLFGTYESVYYGKPMILLPIFADQKANAALLKESGVGIHLQLLKLTELDFLNAINTVINDTSYGERMRNLSRVFRDRPMSAKESVIYWTEYVIRHNGTKHLQSVASDMPLYQFLLLDIVLFIIIAVSIFTILSYYFIKKILSFSQQKHSIWVKNKKNL